MLLDRAMRQLGVQPNGLLGLSCGEWAALATAGGFIDTTLLFARSNVGLTFPDMVYLATGIGGGELAQAIDACGVAADAVVSHENSPAQAIACGLPDAIARLRSALTGRGVFALELPFRSGFHTPHFAPRVADTLRFLGLEAKTPDEEVWSGVTATPVPGDAAACRVLLRRHFVEPVAFAGSLRAMHEEGYRCFVDLGTGSLSQLVAATLAGDPHVAIPVAHHARPGHDGLLRGLLALWAAHRPVDPHALCRHGRQHMAA
jgi:acyl transferase domain-containing protein